MSGPLVLLGQNATMVPHRTSSRSLTIYKPVHEQFHCLNRPSISQLYPFPSKQFHVLLNSLFKVLFNFPSRYLFAIGLGVIFSLTWSLPRTLSCTPKQLDSREKSAQRRRTVLRAYHPLWAVAPVKVDLDWSSRRDETLPNTTFHATVTAGSSVLGSARFIRHY